MDASVWSAIEDCPGNTGMFTGRVQRPRRRSDGIVSILLKANIRAVPRENFIRLSFRSHLATDDRTCPTDAHERVRMAGTEVRG